MNEVSKDFNTLYSEALEKIKHLPEIHLTLSQFEELGEYSATLPSGTYSGKLWKRHDNCYLRDPKIIPVWIVGQFGLEVGRDINIHWYRPVIGHIGYESSVNTKVHANTVAPAKWPVPYRT